MNWKPPSLALAALLLSACAPMTIGRIKADPSRYRNQTIHVSGTVTNSVGVLGRAATRSRTDRQNLRDLAHRCALARIARDRHRRVMPGARCSAQPSASPSAKNTTASDNPRLPRIADWIVGFATIRVIPEHDADDSRDRRR